ncbi:mCG140496 [Mus musculus]|nr:mCG140496 [Mus musculus]
MPVGHSRARRGSRGACPRSSGTCRKHQVHTCGERTTSDVIPQEPFTLFTEPWLLTSLELAKQARLSGSLSPHSLTEQASLDGLTEISPKLVLNRS